MQPKDRRPQETFHESGALWGGRSRTENQWIWWEKKLSKLRLAGLVSPPTWDLLGNLGPSPPIPWRTSSLCFDSSPLQAILIIFSMQRGKRGVVVSYFLKHDIT